MLEGLPPHLWDETEDVQCTAHGVGTQGLHTSSECATNVMAHDRSELNQVGIRKSTLSDVKGKERGYIATSAYEGSLAEAQKEIPATKPEPQA
eukprot:1159354-Pelagomonas_calceolata.AAC.4